MQSSGGVFTFAAAREKPVFMVESGPAAGVMAATYLGSALGYRNVISFDMGGTTAKAGLVQDGRPRVTKEYEVGTIAGASSGGTRGRGYPIRTPVIDLVEIGAGGGSIAWVDSGGVLRVGPHSAGADPGPACYGRGGTEPTITDANLVLGRLNPELFPRRRGPRSTSTPRVRAFEQLRRDARDRRRRGRRGRHPGRRVGHGRRDPARLGRAGPRPARLHAHRLRRRRAVARQPAGGRAGHPAPRSSRPTRACFRRSGCSCPTSATSTAATRILPLEPASEAAIGEILERLEADARDSLRTDRIARRDRRLRRRLEARYVGQSWTLTIDLRARRPGRDRPRGASLVRRAAPTGVRLRARGRADRDRQLHGRRHRREPEPGAARRGGRRRRAARPSGRAHGRGCAVAVGLRSRLVDRSPVPSSSTNPAPRPSSSAGTR